MIPTRPALGQLKGLLPPDAFSTSPRKAVWLLLHVSVALSCYAAIGRVTNVWVIPLFALIAGNSVSCIGILLHEWGHFLIVRSRPLKLTVELLLWSLLLAPRSIWVVFHNAHHAATNMPNDPDRPFVASEKNHSSSLYSSLFYPGRQNVFFKPLIGTRYVLYLAQNLVAALFYSPARKPAFIPATVGFSRRRKLMLLGELLVVALVQSAVFLLAGRSFWRFLWTTPVSVCVASSIISLYHFTEHFLRPVEPVNNPLYHSNSIKVWRFFDALHFNLSYHTEHHLFPSMNSDYYPLLSALLEEKYGDTYRRLGFQEAWRELWQTGAFQPDPTTAAVARPSK